MVPTLARGDGQPAGLGWLREQLLLGVQTPCRSAPMALMVPVAPGEGLWAGGCVVPTVVRRTPQARPPVTEKMEQGVEMRRLHFSTL